MQETGLSGGIIVYFDCESNSESETGLSGGILYFLDVSVTIILGQGLNCSSQGRNPIKILNFPGRASCLLDANGQHDERLKLGKLTEEIV